MCDQDRAYAWGDMSSPYLNLKDENVFKEPSWWMDTGMSISHAVAVMLIKVRILNDLLSINNATRGLQVLQG